MIQEWLNDLEEFQRRYTEHQDFKEKSELYRSLCNEFGQENVERFCDRWFATMNSKDDMSHVLRRGLLVARLSVEMKERLTENVHKGDWRDANINWAVELAEELTEFMESIIHRDGRHWVEAGDVAAVLAMICDIADMETGR